MPARTPEETHAVLEAAIKDADADAAALKPDAAMFDPCERHVVHGRDAIRKSIEPLVAGGRDSEITVLAKLESDGLALTHASWRLGDLSGHARSSRAASSTAAG